MLKRMIILLFMISTAGFVYPQECAGNKDTSEESSQSSTEIKEKKSFLNWINSKAYAENIDKKAERKRLRKDWEKMLGVDIFLPYFKAKKVENWVKDKAKIKLFNMKGKPSLSKDRIQYDFKINF